MIKPVSGINSEKALSDLFHENAKPTCRVINSVMTSKQIIILLLFQCINLNIMDILSVIFKSSVCMFTTEFILFST